MNLSVPVLLTVIAEPLVGLADTAFVKELGAASLGGVGAATAVVSGALWILNFLAVSTHTEVARLDGAGRRNSAGGAVAVALAVAVSLGAVLAIALFAGAEEASKAMGATGQLKVEAVTYLKIRVIGVPFWLVTVVCFGALRGMQDMKTSVWIAVGVDLVNVALDPLFIFGVGDVQGLGVAGAAWATVFSHILGAGISLWVLRKKIHLSGPDWSQLPKLFGVGRDMFIRTGLLTAFLIFGAREATVAGKEAAAAHQAIRQVWMLTAYMLDSVAISAQSLVGFFIGGGSVAQARRVAGVTVRLNLWFGVGITILMVVAEPWVAALLVPASAVPVFVAAWWAAAAGQVANSVSFATDGIHLGTADFSYLRNAMVFSTLLAAPCLFLVDSLAGIWWVTAFWSMLRALLGGVRIWPSWRSSPLYPETSDDPLKLE